MSSLNTDLYKIISTEDKLKDVTSMNDILSVIDKEIKNRKNDNWNKLCKPLKLNILNNFIESETKKYSLTSNESIELSNKLFNIYNNGLLNKKSDLIYNREQRIIEKINGLLFDEDKRVYTYGVKHKVIKSNNKSKTNIERFIRR